MNRGEGMNQIRDKAEVMRAWAAPPNLQPATPWLSLSVALAILNGAHPALQQRDVSWDPDRPDLPCPNCERTHPWRDHDSDHRTEPT